MSRRKKKAKRNSWTVHELTILDEYANKGIAELKKRLSRHSEASIRKTASRQGISIRRRWFCPNCNKTVYEPLKASTGWCRVCSKAHVLDRAQATNREIRMANLGMTESGSKAAEIDRQIQAMHQENTRLRRESNGLGDVS